MNRSEIEREVRATLARLTEQDASGIAADADLGDALGLDSLGRLELLAEVEDRFDVLIEDVDMDKVATIEGIIDVAERTLAPADAGAA
ncbi:MAG TPA: acyl carrier protein [Hyphomicrobiales bacterium]|nr:acyl carrier protein [Hyphomicrobiales bacterium]